MKKPLILLAIAATLVTITVVRARFSAGSTQTVDVQTISTRTIRASILASGVLTYGEQALLTSELVGKVKAIHVQEGDTVVRGQLVLEIDDEEYRADVGQKEAQVQSQRIAIQRASAVVSQSERQWSRSRKLYQDRLVSAQFLDEHRLVYDQSRFALQSAHAQLDQVIKDLAKARNGLGKTRMLSPLDGVVIAVDIKPGETAIPSVASIAGSELMTIADPASIHAEVYVDEADIASLKVGDKAEVVVTSLPDHPLKGYVQRIATAGRVAPGRQGLSFAVRVAFDKPDAAILRPGVSCRAEIYVNNRSGVIAAPVESVLVEEDQNTSVHYVFAVRDGKVEKIKVATGISDDDYQQIVSGLRKGDIIVVGPDNVLRNLRPGDAVDVRKPGALKP